MLNSAADFVLVAEADSRPTSLETSGSRAQSGPRYLHFSLAGRAYAFPVENVLEGGRPLGVTPLPFVPDWILGISNLRGDVLSIVDLRAFLCLASPNLHPEDRLVVVKSLKEDLQVGLIVDRIQGVLPLQEEPRMPTTPQRDRAEDFLIGTCERDSGMLSVLDIERLLLSPAMKQFDGNKGVGEPEGSEEAAEGGVLKRSRGWARRL
jgi:purine-binding chemotaxis protein CheW